VRYNNETSAKSAVERFGAEFGLRRAEEREGKKGQGVGRRAPDQEDPSPLPNSQQRLEPNTEPQTSPVPNKGHNTPGQISYTLQYTLYYVGLFCGMGENLIYCIKLHSVYIFFAFIKLSHDNHLTLFNLPL